MKMINGGALALLALPKLPGCEKKDLHRQTHTEGEEEGRGSCGRKKKKTL